MRIDSSGERNTVEPSTGEANVTPSSVILRLCARLNTWKPPESVRIGLLPADEAMQPAEFADDVEARPQEQMERVAEDDLGADPVELARRHRLDRAVGADRHERGRFDRAAREGDAAAAGGAVGGQ